MTRAVDPGQLAKIRSARQLLHRPRNAGDPADIAKAICGSQAQELPAGRLAFRARSASLTAADVDRARTEERSLVRTWVMRNTVHLIATEDLPWMRPLFAPLMESFNRRRLGQLGIDSRAQDRALSLIKKDLEAEGLLTRTELTERLARKGIGLNTSHRVHIFPLAVMTGVACLGPGEGAATQLVAAADWLSPPRDRERDEALAELARRYLAAFGPASEADFAGWAGLPLRDIRAGLAAVANEIREVSIGGDRAWAPKGRAPSTRPDLVRLLPAYDTYLMGYRDRDFFAAPERWRRIMPGGGILKPTITVGGVAVGLWRTKRSGGRLAVEPDPFSTMDPQISGATTAEIEDVYRFEGMARRGRGRQGVHTARATPARR